MMESYDKTSGGLLAGAIKSPITPTIKGRKVFLAGHGSGRLATDIHDELWVRAVAMRLGEDTLILVALDLLGLLPEDVESVWEQTVEAGVPAHNLIVTCTHNHAGPDTLGLWSKGAFGSGSNARYMHFLRQELVRVIGLAFSAMEPAEAYLARSEIPDLVGDGEGEELAVFQLRTPAGKTVATVVNYPLVPQVMGEDNALVSADFPHWLYSDLERSRDEVTLYICADADENLVPAAQERSWDEAERVGRALAAAVRTALDGVSPTTVDRLHVWRRPISIPVDDPVARWLRRLGVIGRRNLTDGRTSSEVGVVQLGPVRMAVLPGLIAPGLGFEVRKVLDAPYRFLLCMSNDSLGFILPPGSAFPPDETRLSSSRSRRDMLSGSHVGTIILDELTDLMWSVREEGDV